MIPAAVEHIRPSTLAEALDALADPDAKALAGGQSLIPVMKLRIVRPSVLVDIGRLELGGVQLDASELRLGALTTWGELEQHARARPAALRRDRRVRGRDRRPASP